MYSFYLLLFISLSFEGNSNTFFTLSSMDIIVFNSLVLFSVDVSDRESDILVLSIKVLDIYIYYIALVVKDILLLSVVDVYITEG